MANLNQPSVVELVGLGTDTVRGPRRPSDPQTLLALPVGIPPDPPVSGLRGSRRLRRTDLARGAREVARRPQGEQSGSEKAYFAGHLQGSVEPRSLLGGGLRVRKRSLLRIMVGEDIARANPFKMLVAQNLGVGEMGIVPISESAVQTNIPE